MQRTLLLTLVFLIAFSSILYAKGINGQYDGYDIVRVQYEGKELKPIAVPGILYKGSTLVPLGLLREAGFDVGWSQETLTANITQKKPEKPTQTIKTLEQIRALSDRVALIYALDDSGNRLRQGSGFILNSRGLLVTAWHVADENGFRKLEVILNGKTYFVDKGDYLFANKDKDVYGVYLQNAEPFPYLKIGELPKEKDKVYSVGYPAGVFTVFSGEVKWIVKQATRTVDTTKPTGGTSGGPELNRYGEVVGVVTGGNDFGGATWITEVEKVYKQAFNE